MGNFNDQLDAEDLGHPESWRPRPGDRIIGKLIRYDRGESNYGPRWIAVLHVDPSNEYPHGYLCGVWLSHAVLVAKFKELRPKPGERVGVRRLEDSAKGYAMYRVVVEGRGPAIPEWDGLGDNGEVDES